MMKHVRQTLLALALSSTVPVQADMATLKAVADTTLYETNPNNNLGGDATLAAGSTAHGFRNRALIRFDVAGQIPAGALITSAALQVQVIKLPALGGADSTFELRRMLLSWGEGNKTGSTGATATAGEATWIWRSSPEMLWSKPGAVEGTDFSTSISATNPISGGGPYTFASSNLLADVQFWLEHPDTNFGWMLRSQSEEISGTARRLSAVESGTDGPSLTIEFVAPRAPLRITSIALDPTRTTGTLSWTGGTGPFQLQSSPTLNPANWTDVGASTANTSITFEAAASHAFFRVVALRP